MSTRVATIAVHGLKTSSQWVNRLVVQCATDSAMTNVVSTASSSVEWDGTNNKQKDYISFPGLVYGTTYYLRCGSICPVTGVETWSPVQGIQAGTGTAISITYSTTTTVGSSGIRYQVTPNSPPTNVDHYEAYWNHSGTTPDTTAKALWVGETGQNPDFFIPGSITQNVFAWIRVISTDHIPQGWISLPETTIRPIQSQNGELDKWGSVPPFTPSHDTCFTYQSDTGAITWWYDGSFGSSQIVILLADGGSYSIPTGNWTTNSLAASTTYYFYPYLDTVSGLIAFANGGTNSVGTPYQSGYTAASAAAKNVQSTFGHMPLTAGALQGQTGSGTTTGSGTDTGGTGTGGGGGTGGCPKRGMVVMTKTRGIQKVEHIAPGEWIKTRANELTPDGWTQVLRNSAHLECEFIRIVAGNGEEIEQSLGTPMPLARGNKLSSELSLGDFLVVDDEEMQYTQIRKLEITEHEPGTEEAVKHVFMCHPNPEFFCGKTAPTILTHNTLNYKV